MGGRKYNPMIRAWCEARGIHVPPPFDRHPASRFAVVLRDASPPRLSTTTHSKKEDLHLHLRAKMAELGVTSPTALPLEVLDFADQVHLEIGADGRTRPGGSLAAE
jgi:hypothetical protein